MKNILIFLNHCVILFKHLRLCNRMKMVSLKFNMENSHKVRGCTIGNRVIVSNDSTKI